MKLAVGFLLMLSLAAQPALPPSQPGDVFFIDPANGKPFLWIHSGNGRMEPMPGYGPEQVYRLLMDREKACWDIHLQLVQNVNATIAH